MDLQHQSEHGVGAYRHWPDNHPVVGNLLRITRGDFRDAGTVPPVTLDVALDLLRHFFFLEQSGQLAQRGSTRLPWKELTAVLQKAFPNSRLAQLVPTSATTAVTERKKSVLRSLLSANVAGDERARLAVFFPSKEFVRVPANECVTDAMLEAFVDNLTSTTPTPEVRPQVVRSPIPTRATPRSQVLRSPILPPMALPPPGHLQAHPNPPTSPPPPSTTRTARRRLELEADDEIAEADAAVPVTSTAPVPAPVASTVAAVVPALDEAGEEARLVPNAGENVVLEGALGEPHSSCLVLSCLKKSY